MKRETIEIQKELFGGGKSKVQKYADLIVGSRSLGRSSATNSWSCWRPTVRARSGCGCAASCIRACSGAAGATWCSARASCCGIRTRSARRQRGGRRSRACSTRRADNAGITVGSGVFIGRNTILSCKNGDIVLGDQVNIGFNCEIFSASRVTVGASTLFAAYTYLVGGDHDFAEVGVSVLEQGRSSRGIEVGTDAWLGAGVKVLDGVRIGDHAIVGTGAVVNRDVADYVIAVGVPARPVRDRRDDGVRS
jgi:acetyltransferase-like isoleucine patch superfamily enzyme